MESILARICREAQGRVRTNVMVRDMDLPQRCSRRQKVGGGGGRTATAGRCSIGCGHDNGVHRDGRPRRGAADHDGVALTAARRKKERTHPELLGPRRRAQLVVIGVEVGGRWSQETRRSSASWPKFVPKVSVLGEKASSASLAHALGSNVRLCCCPCGGVFLVGHAAESWRGWPVSCSTRGGR